MRTTHQISRESVFLDVGFTKEPAVYVTPFAQKPPTLKNWQAGCGAVEPYNNTTIWYKFSKLAYKQDPKT